MFKVGYSIKVYSKESMSDSRLGEIFKSRQRDLFSDWRDLLQSWGGFQNALSEEIIDYIFHYDKGSLAPDKWDYYEPVRNLVDEQSSREIKNILHVPGMSLLFKRIKKSKNEIAIYNDTDDFLRIPTRGGAHFRHRIGSIYQTNLTLWFGRDAYKNPDECKNILEDLCRIAKTDFGYIEVWDTRELKYDMLDMHLDEVLGVESRYRRLAQKLYDWIGEYANSNSEAFTSGISGYLPIERSFKTFLKQSYHILSSLCERYYPGIRYGLLFDSNSLIKNALDQSFSRIMKDTDTNLFSDLGAVISAVNLPELYTGVGYKATQVEIPEIWDKPFYTLEPPVPNSSPMLLFL